MSEERTQGPLSHSSCTTLMSCEQKYYYYKVEQAPPDEDVEPRDSLSIGKAVHYMAEVTKHTKPDSIMGLLEKMHRDQNIRLDEEHFPLVHAMYLKYLRLHKKMNLKVLAVEPEIKTDMVLGYIDAIMEDHEGRWWIVDLKTYKSLYLPGIPALPRDPQLNLYAAHRALIAEEFNLDPKAFGGCRWRVITKSSAKRKPNDSHLDFVERLLEKHIKAYDIPVPLDLMDVDERLDLHEQMYKRAGELFEGAKPRRNYSACMSYFSPCDFWSRCHGKMYSEFEGCLDVTELA